MKFHLKFNYILILLTTIIFLIIGNNGLFAQLNSEQQDLIRQYTIKINENKTNGQLQTAAYFLNKCALIYMSAGENKEAVDSYLASASINEKLGNDVDTRKIYNNIAMIYSEMGQFRTSVSYFEKSLLINRRNNNKQQIARSLMDISSVLIIDKQYDKAIKNLDEALKLSNDIDDLQNLRTCYSLLTQSYKGLGNTKKSDEYHKYFQAYDKILSEGKTIMPENFKEDILPNQYLSDKNSDSEKFSQNNLEDGSNTQDRNSEMDGSIEKNSPGSRIKTIIFEKENYKSKYKVAEEKNKRYQSIINAGAIVIVFLFLVVIILLYFIVKKQSYIRKIEQE
jgi:tetratricopeptide (TPR) repeat protein